MTTTTTDYVTLADLALRLGMDRSHARRYLLREGYKFARVRGAGNQLSLALTAEEADRAVSDRQRRGFRPVSGDAAQNLVLRPTEDGVFYLVRLVPELSERRLKVGWTSDLEARLASHRTSSPTAELVACWPCKRCWEPAALAVALRSPGRVLGPEVIEAEEPEDLRDRLWQLFSLLSGERGEAG